MKRILISNEERERILEMHVNATKRNYLREQLSRLQAPKPVERSISTFEILGSTDRDRIISPKPLTDRQLPATTSNYMNYFQGDINALAKNNLSGFKDTGRKPEVNDIIIVKYQDGTVKELKDSGSIQFSTSGLTTIIAAGNGLLALGRALGNRTQSGIPNKVSITLAGTREGSGTSYLAPDINKLPLGNLLYYYLKNYVIHNKIRVPDNYPGYTVFNGIKEGVGTLSIESLIGGMMRNAIPPPKGDVDKIKYYDDVYRKSGINMNVDYFKNEIENSPKDDKNKLDSEWDRIQDEIIKTYKENVGKYLKNYRNLQPNEVNDNLLKINPPKTPKPTVELQSVGSNFVGGQSSTPPSPQQQVRSQQYQSGK